MKVIYALEEFEKETRPLILVGPTPRSRDVVSWRLRALEILRAMEYGVDGGSCTVFVPEPRDQNWTPNYHNQIDWEHNALTLCAKHGKIACWVPRNLETLPGFTTNVEFGLFLASGNLFYGRPEGAPKTRYLDHIFKLKTGLNPWVTLEELLAACTNFT